MQGNLCLVSDMLYLEDIWILYLKPILCISCILICSVYLVFCILSLTLFSFCILCSRHISLLLARILVDWFQKGAIQPLLPRPTRNLYFATSFVFFARIVDSFEIVKHLCPPWILLHISYFTFYFSSVLYFAVEFVSWKAKCKFSLPLPWPTSICLIFTSNLVLYLVSCICICVLSCIWHCILESRVQL